MELTEHEILILEWLFEHKPKRFSVNNKSEFSEEFQWSFHWGPMVGSSDNIHNVLSNLFSIHKLIEVDGEGYYLSKKGTVLIQNILGIENEVKIDKELTRQKLWYETENAKSKFDDYPRILLQRNILFATQIITIALAILALILKR